MWYAQRDGYTPGEQQRRERLRLDVAERFARDDTVKEIAHYLGVTEGPVRRWRRAWLPGVSRAAICQDAPVWAVVRASRRHPLVMRPAGAAVK